MGWNVCKSFSNKVTVLKRVKFLPKPILETIYYKTIVLSVSFGFHGPPLLTFKTNRLDLRGLDLEKMTSFTHQLKISVCKRNLLFMQNTSLKV